MRWQGALPPDTRAYTSDSCMLGGKQQRLLHHSVQNYMLYFYYTTAGSTLYTFSLAGLASLPSASSAHPARRKS